MKEQPLFQATEPLNLTVEQGQTGREQYDILWNRDKAVQEEWNRAHFTGWKGGMYIREGQVYGKQKKG